jgi:superfamily I DNA/RNA helicase
MKMIVIQIEVEINTFYKLSLSIMGKGTLTIYNASAGSGKTYTLTGIYLSEIFRSRYNYRKILAVTFTNKATAEMKSRILENLHKLSPSTYADDAAKSEKKLTIGGKRTLDNYALRFVHTKDDGNKLRVTMIVTASNGFTLTFQGDKETVIDALFKALSQDTGTLIEIRDQYTPAAP